MTAKYVKNPYAAKIDIGTKIPMIMAVITFDFLKSITKVSTDTP